MSSLRCCCRCKGNDVKSKRLRKFPHSGGKRRASADSSSTVSDSEYEDFAVAGAKANNTFLSVRHLVKLVAIELFVYLVWMDANDQRPPLRAQSPVP